MVLALAIISNILWFLLFIWREVSAKKERENLTQEIVDISLDCMNRLQARNPGDFRLLSDASKKFQNVSKPLTTEEMKSKVFEKTQDDMNSEMEKALAKEGYNARALASGRGRVI